MAKAAKKIKLTSLSEIYAYFRQNQTPITFLSPTPYNILGLGRWINKFEYINFFDSFDGTHPKIVVPREHGPHEFKSIEDVNNYLLRHKEVRARLKERGPGLLMLVMFDEETEFLAGELGLQIALPPPSCASTSIPKSPQPSSATKPASRVPQTLLAGPKPTKSSVPSPTRQTWAATSWCKRPTAIQAAPRFSSSRKPIGTATRTTW